MGDAASLGLDKPEVIIYQAILAGPATDTSGLAAQTGLAEANVHAALAALTALNLVRAAAEPGHWEPVNPRSVLAAIIRHHEPRLPCRRDEISAAAPAPVRIDRLEVPGSLRAQAENLICGTKSQLHVTVAAYQGERGCQASLLPEASWAANGVTVEVLYHDSVRFDPAAMSNAAGLTSPSWQARTTYILTRPSPTGQVVLRKGSAWPVLVPKAKNAQASAIYRHSLRLAATGAT